ncbi:MAG: DNA-binding response regulator [Ignavibacteria bacterium GWA2_54_16]|nr:MAG: DNA-binding response regulator [Ignavibacteria bacterium GWA2_54_16]
MKRILIVEDDKAILRGLVDSLKAEHFEIETSSDGEEGLGFAKRRKFDLIILDVMLPGMNGFEICKQLRTEKVKTPILMLTGKGDEIDKVMGLELGADDYVTKPFSIKELIARVRALLRRQAEIHSSLNEASFGDVYIDFKKQEATRGKKSVDLTSKEFQLLKYFVEREGEVISRNQLLDSVWGYDALPTTRTVDNYILSLRKKIEKNPAKPRHLLTVHTAGYKFQK